MVISSKSAFVFDLIQKLTFPDERYGLISRFNEDEFPQGSRNL